MPGPAGFLLQKVFGGSDEALAFARIHAFQCAAPGQVPAGANFDEYYCIAVQHDQIKLAAPAQPVLREQAQSVLFQMGTRLGFGGVPLAPGAGLAVAQMPLFSSG
ncbi:hypothetical protein D3C76_813390 [compost metagenome]